MKLVKTTAAAIALSFATLTLPVGIDTAEAGRVVKKRVVVHKYHPRYRQYGWRRYHHHGGNAFAAGVLGFAAGAVIGGAIVAQPQPVYVVPVR